MSARAPAFFPLFADLETLKGVGPKTAEAMGALGITTPRDLLFHLPSGGQDRRLRASVQEVSPGMIATVEVEIGAHHPPAKSGRPYRIEVQDSGVSFTLIYFHARGAYLRDLAPPGSRRLVSGKMEIFDGIYQMPHPDHVLPVENSAQIPAFEPIYPLTAGVSARVMSTAIAGALARLPEDVAEWHDPALVAREHWPDWIAALRAAHAPSGESDLAQDAPARRRLAYDEVLAHQLMLGLARADRAAQPGRASQGSGVLQDQVLAALPFAPTGAQRRALAEIAADLATGSRMYRLLQGDVGAGKTLVAFLALLIAVEAGGQGALMAPTELLARQHLASLRQMAGDLPIRIEAILGADGAVERREKRAALAAGEIHIAVGTHALFQKDVGFADLRLAVIDEQHRFGVRERLRLAEKGPQADILVMTATPIPRSLALSAFGDMDLSVLDEKPPGRKPVRTALVSDARLEEMTSHLKGAIARGQQAYWVCPLVQESDLVDLVAVEDRARSLRAALGTDQVALVHGQMPSEEKEAEMAAFREGRRAVLVATTVIEVGVDVPNASIMVIERAESFGLAQLHQLRGRVGRGGAEATCVLLYRAPLSDTGERRLKLLRDTEDGFRIAEEDLAIRGAGDVLGTAQSGLPRFRMADAERQSGLMAMARRDAAAILARDPQLESPRGHALRLLLDLMDQARALTYLNAG
ncbi:MAG: ATP-dependent DNA helicase RecG [Mangrovicoccus sp.]|nr:ATP-dependent DNA helicase RecG [Mangrovicoccus sp.]